jgi:predicted Fe-Mo cluster-binding NifX family protein
LKIPIGIISTATASRWRRQVDAIIVGGIGCGALRKLLLEGIKVYRAAQGSVQDNLELLTSGKLAVFTADQTCAEHGIGDSCPH